MLVLGFAPTIYTTLRVFWLAQLPDVWTFSIAGQLTWVNLLYEILNEGIILPLFYFIGSCKDRPAAFANRIRTGMLAALAIYAGLAALVSVFAEPLLLLMAADTDIIPAATGYIRIESIANVFSVLAQFALVALVTVNKSRYLYILTAARLVLCAIADVFLVAPLPCSLNLGIYGIGCSDILVNGLLWIISLLLLTREGIPLWRNDRPDFGWLKALFRVGGISGLESLVRNAAYMVMICRMVNVVGEQGTYWVADQFIWSWLLLPVLQLGELIKQEVSAAPGNFRKRVPGYFAVTGLILMTWLVSMPAWPIWMRNVLGLTNAEQVLSLVLCLVGFYGAFAFQNVCDAIFYGLGKTTYMLAESVITNVVYYGGAFALYAAGVWQPTLIGIALLFGFGTVFDSVVSFLAYRHLLKTTSAPGKP